MLVRNLYQPVHVTPRGGLDVLPQLWKNCSIDTLRAQYGDVVEAPHGASAEICGAEVSGPIRVPRVSQGAERSHPLRLISIVNGEFSSTIVLDQLRHGEHTGPQTGIIRVDLENNSFDDLAGLDFGRELLSGAQHDTTIDCFTAGSISPSKFPYARSAGAWSL